jgi:hypothetical protein
MTLRPSSAHEIEENIKKILFAQFKRLQTISRITYFKFHYRDGQNHNIAELQRVLTFILPAASKHDLRGAYLQDYR